MNHKQRLIVPKTASQIGTATRLAIWTALAVSIASKWPKILSQVIENQKSVYPRKRVQFLVEPVVMILYFLLYALDKSWTNEEVFSLVAAIGSLPGTRSTLRPQRWRRDGRPGGSQSYYF